MGTVLDAHQTPTVNQYYTVGSFNFSNVRVPYANVLDNQALILSGLAAVTPLFNRANFDAFVQSLANSREPYGNHSAVTSLVDGAQVGTDTGVIPALFDGSLATSG